MAEYIETNRILSVSIDGDQPGGHNERSRIAGLKFMALSTWPYVSSWTRPANGDQLHHVTLVKDGLL